MRRWLKKGKKQGFTTVPFSSALRAPEALRPGVGARGLLVGDPSELASALPNLFASLCISFFVFACSRQHHFAEDQWCKIPTRTSAS